MVNQSFLCKEKKNVLFFFLSSPAPTAAFEFYLYKTPLLYAKLFLSVCCDTRREQSYLKDNTPEKCCRWGSMASCQVLASTGL